MGMHKALVYAVGNAKKRGNAPETLIPNGHVTGSGYQQKDRKPSQNDKTEHGMEKDCAKSRPKSKNAKGYKSQYQKNQAVKPIAELKNTIGCQSNPSDGPGKPNSIIMKTVKSKRALINYKQPICVHLTKTVKTLKAQS
ncbi:hypothetical protein Tco_1310334 [Tanacetum coccineum]